MFGNVRLAFRTVLENLRKSSESGRKSSENHQKSRHQYVCIIKKYYTLAQRYESYVLVARTISHSFDAPSREILFLPLEHKIRHHVISSVTYTGSRKHRFRLQTVALSPISSNEKPINYESSHWHIVLRANTKYLKYESTARVAVTTLLPTITTTITYSPLSFSS